MSEELKFTVDLTGREMYNIVIALNHEWQALADRAIQMGQDCQEDLDKLNDLHHRLVGVMLAEGD